MICIVFGTTGELIKLFPVLRRIRERGAEYVTVTTGQQVQQIPALLEELRLPQPDLWLARGYRGCDLEHNPDIPRWLATVTASFARERRTLRRRLGARAAVVVHGDTMTTVLGSLMGRALRVPVAHVEAGVRTWDLRNPFPEELNRRVVSRIATIHYAPGAHAIANLRGRGNVVDTGSNTIRDAVLLAADASTGPGRDEPRYGIVSLHRYELLNDGELLRRTVETLVHGARVPLLWIDHPVTSAALRRWGLEHLFADGLVRRVARMSFFSYLRLLRDSAFLVTDSGGSQVESHVLDVPCLVHRKVVEQPEGVGENVVVSGFRLTVLADFLRDPSRHRARPLELASAPSDVIVGDLVRRGFV